MRKSVGAWTVEHVVDKTLPTGQNRISIRKEDGIVLITTSMDKTVPELILLLSKARHILETYIHDNTTN